MLRIESQLQERLIDAIGRNLRGVDAGFPQCLLQHSIFVLRDGKEADVRDEDHPVVGRMRGLEDADDVPTRLMDVRLLVGPRHSVRGAKRAAPLLVLVFAQLVIVKAQTKRLGRIAADDGFELARREHAPRRQSVAPIQAILKLVLGDRRAVILDAEHPGRGPDQASPAKAVADHEGNDVADVRMEVGPTGGRRRPSHVLVELIGHEPRALVQVIDRIQCQLQRRSLGRADEHIVAEVGLAEEILPLAAKDHDRDGQADAEHDGQQRKPRG